MKDICVHFKQGRCKYGQNCKYSHSLVVQLLDPPRSIFSYVQDLDLHVISIDEMRYSLKHNNTMRVLDNMWIDNYTKMYKYLNNICKNSSVIYSPSSRLVDLRVSPGCFNLPFNMEYVEKHIIKLQEQDPVNTECKLVARDDCDNEIIDVENAPGFVKEYAFKRDVEEIEEYVQNHTEARNNFENINREENYKNINKNENFIKKDYYNTHREHDSNSKYGNTKNEKIYIDGNKKFSDYKNMKDNYNTRNIHENEQYNRNINTVYKNTNYENRNYDIRDNTAYYKKNDFNRGKYNYNNTSRGNLKYNDSLRENTYYNYNTRGNSNYKDNFRDYANQDSNFRGNINLRNTRTDLRNKNIYQTDRSSGFYQSNSPNMDRSSEKKKFSARNLNNNDISYDNKHRTNSPSKRDTQEEDTFEHKNIPYEYSKDN